MLHQHKGHPIGCPLCWWNGVFGSNHRFARGAKRRSFAEGSPLGVSAKSTYAFERFPRESVMFVNETPRAFYYTKRGTSGQCPRRIHLFRIRFTISPPHHQTAPLSGAVWWWEEVAEKTPRCLIYRAVL